MDEKNYTGMIPENSEGKEITAEASVCYKNEDEARTFYETAKSRLLSVNEWRNIAGKLSANFQLTDAKGKDVNRLVEKGDHFKIDIGGPGSKAGEGFDWARVVEIKEVHLENTDSIAVQVRPTSNPQNESSTPAHFYSEGSTSTFVVTREKEKLIASIYDRNIEANEESNNLLDKIRNVIVGLGAKHGFSKLQWEALAEALIKQD